MFIFRQKSKLYYLTFGHFLCILVHEVVFMQLVYYSFTNNTKRFVDKLQSDIDIVELNDYNRSESFILITPTYNIGQIPKPVKKFLEEHGSNMLGVIGTGNKNWGPTYGLASNKIASMYDVTLLYKLELSGNKKDIEIVDNIIKNMT